MSAAIETVLRRFDRPDEVREFSKGRFELISLGGMTIGRATYQPGWRWSVDVGAETGQTLCQVEHVGMVVSGCATAASRSSAEFPRMRARSFSVVTR